MALDGRVPRRLPWLGEQTQCRPLVAPGVPEPGHLASVARSRSPGWLRLAAQRQAGDLSQCQRFEHARGKVTDILQQQVLSTADCARLEPALADGGFVGGIYTPNEEVAVCHAFCQRLAARLEASGRCRFMLGRKVTGIRHAKGRVQAIELGDEVMPVEHLVLAAGYRSAELGVPLPLYPLKGYSLSVPIGAQHQAPNVSITDYDRKIVYARIGEQLRVAAMVDIVGFDARLEPKRLALMKRQALETFPRAGDYDQAVEWAGMRPATPTGVAADRRQCLS
ncbi:FAD dependent oxidoreductase domain-containing protein [Ditylenchus destructor]|nr:FAD dependent oxidoreductase domain-containing protein [Ditylenchus destructor]